MMKIVGMQETSKQTEPGTYCYTPAIQVVGTRVLRDLFNDVHSPAGEVQMRRVGVYRAGLFLKLSGSYSCDGCRA